MLKWQGRHLYLHLLSHNNSLAVPLVETVSAMVLQVAVLETVETRNWPRLPGTRNSSQQARLLVRDLPVALIAVAVVHARTTVSRATCPGLAPRLTNLHLQLPLNKLPRN